MEESECESEVSGLNPRDSIHQVVKEVYTGIKSDEAIETWIRTSESIGSFSTANEVIRLKHWFALLESCRAETLSVLSQVKGTQCLFKLFCESGDSRVMAWALRCTAAHSCLKRLCSEKKEIEERVVQLHSCELCDPQEIEDFLLTAGRQVIIPSSVIQTCFEILIGNLRTSTMTTELHIWSQDICNVWMIRIIMKALARSSDNAYKLAVRNLTVLVATNPFNLKKISMTDRWNDWLVPILTSEESKVQELDPSILVPRRVATSVVVSDVTGTHDGLKMEVYILSSVVVDLFKAEKKEKFVDSVKATLCRLQHINESHDYLRLVLFCVLNSVKEFLNELPGEGVIESLDNVFALLEITEEFVLFKEFNGLEGFGRSLKCSWNKKFGLLDLILIEKVLGLLDRPIKRIDILLEQTGREKHKRFHRYKSKTEKRYQFWSSLEAVLKDIQTMSFLKDQESFVSRVETLGLMIEARLEKSTSFLRKITSHKKQSIKTQLLELAAAATHSQLVTLIRPDEYVKRMSEEKIEALDVLSGRLELLQSEEIDFEEGERKFGLLKQFQKQYLLRRLSGQEEEDVAFEREFDVAHSLKRGKLLLDKARAVRMHSRMLSGSRTSGSSE